MHAPFRPGGSNAHSASPVRRAALMVRGQDAEASSRFSIGHDLVTLGKEVSAEAPADLAIAGFLLLKMPRGACCGREWDNPARFLDRRLGLSYPYCRAR